VRQPARSASVSCRAAWDDPGHDRRRRAAEAALKRLPNYRSYLACGDAHCSFVDQAFYATRVDGVSLRDWVADLAAGRDVSCPLCRGR
jgi:hypothetical protein